MKPAAIFALAVRLLGLYFVYNAVMNFPMCFLSVLTFFHEVAVVAAAVWCLRGAPQLHKWAYPEEYPQQPPHIPAAGSPFAPETKTCANCGKQMPRSHSVCPHCGAHNPA